MANPTNPRAFGRQLKLTFTAATVCAGLVFLSYTWVDRPLARFVNQHRGFTALYEAMWTPAILPLPFAEIYLLNFAYRIISGRPRRGRTNLYLTISMAVLVANTAKDELNLMFERVSPLEWLRRSGDYVQPFTDSGFFGGFPSGHAALITAPMFVLWWRLSPNSGRSGWLLLPR